MRKSFFTVFILCFICLIANANNVFDGSYTKPRDPERMRPPRERPANSDFGKRAALGVLFGSGVDWLNPKADSMQRAGTVANLKYGVTLDINFTTKNNYYFSTGVFFNHSGGKLRFNTYLEDSLTVVTTDRKFRTVYVTIPTGIKLKTPSIKNFVVVANFGLYHSFRINSNYFDDYSLDGTLNKSEKHVYKSETAFFRESAYIGLGLEYVIKSDFRVFFYATYVHGFLNYFNPKNSHNLIYGSKDKATLSGVELQIGITF